MGNLAAKTLDDTLREASRRFDHVFYEEQDKRRIMMETAAMIDGVISEFNGVWFEADVDEDTGIITMSVALKDPPYFEGDHAFWRIVSRSAFVCLRQDPDSDNLCVTFRFPGIWAAA